MRIISVRLCNIKKFEKEKFYDFSIAETMNTISGKNGSGKSTIFECAMLCQKAFFVKLLEENIIDYNNEIMEEISSQLFSMSVKKDAFIELGLRFCKTDFINKNITALYSSSNIEDGIEVFDIYIVLKVDNIIQEKVNWHIEVCEGENKGLLNEFWNLQMPSQIIVYLDADKNVYEDDFTYKKISMISEEEINPIVRFVLHPKHVYQNMYDIMMNSYLYQRINPQTPKKDLFFSESKKMFGKLVNSVGVSNFSGKERKDQFILISKGNGKFDARNFSSGEKLIWYTLLLLNYVKKIGVLVIDEPENHLHEELAWSLISFLKQAMKKEISDILLGQVFLITHAKNLIYNNFSGGSNYVIDIKGNMILIDKENCEDILRECGISYIDDKVLFVEGKTESDNLKMLCGENNIRIRELANCSEIIQVYTSLVKVKELVYAPKFLFIIDRDTREDGEIEKIRELDTEFFDKHFLVLPVHEFENFFIDEKVITEAINIYINIIGGSKLSEKEVEEILRTHADESLEDTKRKYINNVVREDIKCFVGLIKQREIDIYSQSSYEKYIDKLFKSEEYKKNIIRMKEEYSQMSIKYGMLNWTTEWKKICDGKRVYAKTIKELSDRIGVSTANIKKIIYEISKEKKDSELMLFWQEVTKKIM